MSIISHLNLYKISIIIDLIFMILLGSALLIGRLNGLIHATEYYIIYALLAVLLAPLYGRARRLSTHA